MKKSLLAAAIVHAPTVVAADGGADTALAHGIMPRAVIGDFDSISPAARARIAQDRQHRIAEQDSTDFEKCLARIAAPLIIGVGFGGGRLDHHLAALHGLLRYPERPCILLGRNELVFLTPPDLRLDLPLGSRVSLFPMARLRASSRGLRWPLDEIDFAPGARIATSNEVSGPVHVRARAPGMLIILSVARLDQVVRALAAPRAPRWAAR